MASELLRIVNGPSKFDIMLALFDRTGDRKIEFKVQDGRKMTVRIYGVLTHGYEETWEITGFTSIVSGVWTEAYKITFRTDKRRGYARRN